jgi:hypothetical protein
MMRRFILSVAVLTTSACGMRSYVSAEDSKYPISLSSGLRDEHGKLLGEGELEKLGTLKVNYMACTMLWSAVGLGNRTRDISEDVNREVAARRGEGVINLTIESSGTIFEIITLVGVLPDCAHVRVRGDIVQRIPGKVAVGTSPAAASAPTP